MTRQYPTAKYILPPTARNRLYVNMDDCIGCDQCARACPVNCIEIETVKAVPGENLGVTFNNKRKALWVTKFDIDLAKCCYCGLCVPPCPTFCITMSDTFEFSESAREGLIYHFATMDEAEAEEHRLNAVEAQEATSRLRAQQAAERAMRDELEGTKNTPVGIKENRPTGNAQPSSSPGSIPPPPFSRTPTIPPPPVRPMPPTPMSPPPFKMKPDEGETADNPGGQV